MPKLQDLSFKTRAPLVIANAQEQRIHDLEQYALEHPHIHGAELLEQFHLVAWSERNLSATPKKGWPEPTGNPTQNEGHITHSYSGRGSYGGRE